MMYTREYESMDREDLTQLQIERLQLTLNRVYRNVAFYNDLFDRGSVNIEGIKSLDDLKSLPFTTKEDLRKSYPYDMFAVPLKDIVRIHSTSGTTGKPIVVGYTKTDIALWSSLTARVLVAAGVTEHDFIQIAFNYHLFTGGFGFHYAAEKVGASVIPSSNSEIRKQITIMRDFKTSVLVSTPGFALHIAALLEEQDIHPETLNLKIGSFGAEPWSESLRGEIERTLHIDAYDNYGITEVIGPGVAYECAEKNGLHVNEDHFLVEIIDPDSLEPLPLGEKGELVFTTLTKLGFPLVRYRTGDISRIIPGECPCGRTLVRMEKVTGRTDDMIIIEGTNVFPSQIEAALLEIEGIEPHYEIILDRKEGVDSLEIKVEVSDALSLVDDIRSLEEFRNRIRDRLHAALDFRPVVTLVEPKSLRRSSGGKMSRVTDRREM
ncbi:MAG: phenylacetate--CoA ligase family protein [Spirochaetota bacterium]